MKYKIEVTTNFIKQYRKLDKNVQQMIYTWIKKHIYECLDPRSYGKPLENDLKGLWRYRIGDYRLIVQIIDKRAVIIMIKIGYRKEVYK